ncbi:MAG: hypothetical protein R3190_14060, partial [Thermoanaerobaculia bacterium]|nr:hypothetical protein [Thermoanaerobaculia bacterium]
RAACVDEVLAALQAGKVRLGTDKDPEAPENLPRLADVPKGTSPKQSLLWLRRQGSLSPYETKEAAGHYDRNPQAGVAAALIAAGAERLVDHVPPIPEEPDGRDDNDAETAPAEEPEEEEGAKDEAPKEAAPPLTIGRILEKSVVDAIAALDRVRHPPTLLTVLVEEARGKDRKTLKDHVFARLEGQFPKAELLRAYEGTTTADGPATAEAMAEDLEE